MNELSIFVVILKIWNIRLVINESWQRLPLMVHLCNHVIRATIDQIIARAESVKLV